MVFATQNPFESEGTFPLPEAQLDRFLVHTLVDYPDAHAEQRILKEHAAGKLVGEQFGETKAAEPQLGAGQIAALIERTQRVHVDDALLTGIRDLVRSTRPEDELCPEPLKGAIWYGAGPRAGISLVSMARALALTESQEAVRWTHVRRLAKPVLRHRLRLTAQGARDGLDEDGLIDQVLARLEERQTNLAKGI
jgi:MoxR-like ATPase